MTTTDVNVVPQNEIAEKSLLGLLLKGDVSPSELEAKGINAEHFHCYRAQFNEISTFAQNGGGDISVFIMQACESGRLDEIGGAAFYTALAHEGVAAAMPAYIEALRKTHDQRLALPLESIAQAHDLTCFHNDDSGNAERFHAIFGDDFRYHRDSGTWLRWNGIRWVSGNDEVIQSFIQAMRLLAKQATAMADHKAADLVTKHAFKSCDLHKVKAGLELARSIPKVSVTSSMLDHDAMLVCAENAVIDLRTGLTVPPNRSHLITKQIGTHYDPDATCPLWLSFLDTVTGGDRELMVFLQMAVGYTLTGLTSEQCLFFLHGRGQNGKGVFTSTIEALLGDYSQTAPESLFVVNRNGGGIPNDLARLVGCRLSVAAELDEGAAFAESRLKSLTGSDTITARFLHKEYFDFAPTHKFWISGNHKPAIRGTDTGIWRRIRLIPFTVTIPDEKKDKRLSEKLKDEMPGILNWAIDGCLKWRNIGLIVPSCVKAATDEYRAAEDVVGQFLDEATIPEGETTKSELYLHYIAWCDRSGIGGRSRLTSRKFNDRISERGCYDSGRKNSGVFWTGISKAPLW
jgi:putative DNA primase/helicase